MNKLFTNDKFFLTMTICGFLGYVVYLFMVCFTLGFGYILTRMPLLIEAVCVLFLYYSYKKHSKNVMKGLMGAVLMAMLLASINSFSNLYYPVEYVFTTIFFCVALLLFICHFLINSDRYSNPGLIMLNQVLCLIYALDMIAWDILWITADKNVLNIMASFVNIIACIGEICVIVCVESRLDAYRLDREAAGWTEEKGYPANYARTKNYGVNRKK